MIFDAMTDITLITVVLVGASQVLQSRFIDREKMKRQQEGMKEKQKVMQELMKKDDPKSRNELESMQAQMMAEMQEMMQGSMKMMVASLALFLPAFAIIGFLYGEAVIQLPIPLPWFGKESLIELYSETNWYGWYFVSYLCITVVVNILKKIAKNMGVMNG